MAYDGELTLRFHHNVIEHLGLRLYQNKPAKVICELISNSWDADATHVAVQIEPSDAERPNRVACIDNGLGMSRKTLQSAFLTIASPRRGKANSVTTSIVGRPLMGRKGLGKLAPFGICKRVNVITIHAGLANWIELDLDKISAVSPDIDSDKMGEYHPQEVLTDAPADELQRTQHGGISGGILADHILRHGNTSGTAIVMTEMIERIRIVSADIRRAIGRRFTVTLARPDFSVLINGSPLSEDEIFPAFDYRLPPTGFLTDTVGGNTVKYWVGFTRKPIVPATETGVGVFAHGKLAQERPFFFNMKGNDIYQPYIYGVVEADWIDELSEDIISTDRSSLDWDHPSTQFLLGWGQRNLRRWIASYQEQRQSTEQDRNMARVMEQDKRIKKMTQPERESLVKLLSEITPKLPDDEAIVGNVTDALTDAWLHKPARDMIDQLWKEFQKRENAGENILPIIKSIRDHMVPEAMSSTVTLSQKAFALGVLDKLIHAGTEPDLQKLIEAFPWLLGPMGEYVTANQQLKSFVLEAEKEGLIPRQSDKKTDDVIDETLKPDFVFLSDANRTNIVVVEIKSPQIELSISNREQLSSYLTFCETKYPDADISGLLIGNAPHGFRKKREDISVVSWNEVFIRARAAYADIIASLIDGYADSSKDLRLKDVQSYGGPEMWRIIEAIADKDEHLRDLIADVNGSA